ncbi:monofunctional biosynthetic peptidoglycan transglycosylase [Marinobacter nitratireducens]|nr:monofunctional biosynthetic peptidoglycan transglycosylase [Marinobacter nitratireducens]
MAKKSFPQKILRLMTRLVAAVIAFMLLIVLLFRFVNPPTSAFMLAHQVEYPDQRLQQSWVALDEVSPWMPLAVMASEDQRFPEHWGVDFVAIRKALSEYSAGDGLRGASTITQQTAKNLFLWNGRSFIRKLIEAALALGMELLWPKERILEVYLNIAEFGPGIYGVEAASQAFFGRSARLLNDYQSALLAAVLPNPKVLDAGMPSAYVQQRVSWIRNQMPRLPQQIK